MRSEENSSTFLTFHSPFLPNSSIIAFDVELEVFCAFKIFDKIFFIEDVLLFEKVIKSTTFIVPSVMVPVLSRHKTFVLASISIEYRSRTKVFFFASLTTPTASAMVISRNIPAGIMLVNAPDVFVICCSIVLSKEYSFKKVKIPIGTRAMPIYLINLFKSLKRFEAGALNSFAF